MSRPHLALCLSLLAGWSLACSGAQQKPVEASPSSPTEGATPTEGSAADAPKPIDGGAGSTSLAVESTDAAPTKLEPLPNTKEVSPDAGHTKTPPRHEAGRTPSDVQKAVVAVRDQARACYDAGEKQHTGIEGDLVMTFTIDPKGIVSNVSADLNKSAIVDDTIIACVSGVLKKLTFPASPGGFETHSNYPFTFHPHRHPAGN